MLLGFFSVWLILQEGIIISDYQYTPINLVMHNNTPTPPPNLNYLTLLYKNTCIEAPYRWIGGGPLWHRTHFDLFFHIKKAVARAPDYFQMWPGQLQLNTSYVWPSKTRFKQYLKWAQTLRQCCFFWILFIT